MSKICPIISSGFSMSICRESGCMAWIPDQKVEWRCTCDIKNDQHCPLYQVVDTPEKMVLFCDGCEYYKMFEIKVIPAHCRLIGGIHD